MIGDRIDRHLVARFVKATAASVAGACLLYAVIDFADRAQGYTGRAWALWALRMYALRLTKVAVLISPSAILMGAGLTVSSLRHRSEWVALLAAGRSPARLVLPMALAALLLGGLIYEFDDAYAVHAAGRADRIALDHFHFWGGYRSYYAQKRWLRVGSKLVHLGDPDDSGGFRDSSILELSRDFRLVERLDAERFVPGGAGLDLHGVERRRFIGDQQTLEWLPDLHLDLPEGEKALRLATGRPEGMSRAELGRQISFRSALGITSAEQRYEYYSRLAYGLAGLAGALLAIALALRRGRTGHVNTTLVEGLIIAAALWALLGIARALSIAGRLPPVVCAFGPEVLTLGVGLLALIHVNRSALL